MRRVHVFLNTIKLALCRLVSIFVYLTVFEPSSLQAQSDLGSSNNRPVLSLAVVGALTPSSKSFGIAQLQGVTLAVDDYNRPGGSSIQIQLDIYDDKADQSTIPSIMRRISLSGAFAIIGPANSRTCEFAIKQLESNIQIPVISPLCTASVLTKKKTNFFFRANVSDEKRLSKLLKSIMEGKTIPRRLLAFYEAGDPFGVGMLHDTETYLEDSYSVFHRNKFSKIEYERDLTEDKAVELITSAIGNDLGTKPEDGILLLGISPDVVTFIRALRRREVKSTIYVVEPDQSEFSQALKQSVTLQGVHVITSHSATNPLINKFDESFFRKFKEGSAWSAALAYDATRLLLAALDAALAERPSLYEDVQELRAEIPSKLPNSTSKVDFVVPGDHSFDAGEYLRLAFEGLQYDCKGRFVGWSEVQNEKCPSPEARPEMSARPIIYPPLYCLLVVAILGYVGSITRQVIHRLATNKTTIKFVSIIKDVIRSGSPIAILEALISIGVGSFVFIIILLKARQWLEDGDSASLIYNYGAAILAFFTGLLGTTVLYIVPPIVGPFIKSPPLPGRDTAGSTQQD